MKKSFSFTVFMTACSAAIITACAAPVHAKGYSSPSRSSFSRPAPKPAPRVVNRTTNNTTVIRETRWCKGTVVPVGASCRAWLVALWAVWVALCWGMPSVSLLRLL